MLTAKYHRPKWADPSPDAKVFADHTLNQRPAVKDKQTAATTPPTTGMEKLSSMRPAKSSANVVNTATANDVIAMAHALYPAEITVKKIINVTKAVTKNPSEPSRLLSR